ncbi:MAG: polyphosphate kinase 2 family protein [Candidatus Eremiobacteraeota bacterium]|nr:polyphosphate kinase 2 family protein [Candidatus Eremiobacteraeota bacterium]
MNYRKKFVVEPGTKVRLDELDPSYTGKHEAEAEAKVAIQADLERLRQFQYRLYAEHERSVLIVLQAADAAGKDGTVRHVFGAFNPQGAAVRAFKVPTIEEAAHDFLWRVHAATPARGHIAIFNRSHYEDVLAARVHGLVPKPVWTERYDRINEFEKNLAQAGTHILKFFLHISPDEQLRRFKKRIDDQQSWWKLNESDYSERKHWAEYQKAYEDVLERCSTKRAPWYVIPADHKWFRNLAVARIVADTLDELDLQLPKPAADLDAIRREYEAAAATPSPG